MKKIFLLGEDDSDDIEMFHEALNEIDPSIILQRASDGQDLLQKLKNKELEEPHIIFLDINMTGMNGWNCLTELKSHEQLRHIPVVIDSTSSFQTNAEKAIGLGALCFFTKPSDFQELKSILEVFAANLHGNLLEGVNKFNVLQFRKVFVHS